MRRAIVYLSFLFFCFFFLFLFVSHAAGPTTITGEITAPTFWTKGNSPYIVMGQVVVKSPLTIEAGAVVKFGKNNSLDSLKIQSDFFVNGTREEPVFFTSIHDDSDGNNSDNSSKVPQMGDWSSINFNPSLDYEMKIKYAKLRYSSSGVYIIPSSRQTKDISIKDSEFEKNGIGILVGNAEPLIEKNTIKNNTTGIKVNNTSAKTTKAISNAIFANGAGAFGKSSLYPDAKVLEAEYNWWGAKAGPYNEILNPDGAGNPVAGQVSFDPWIEEDPVQTPDPVIVIPGIMGSWGKDGKWQIDPIFHTYDNLCEEFLANGYENGKNFSVFPYQWRDSNVKNAKLLHKRIQDIKSETRRPKVDIVAHSMGGLLAREYIESGDYEDDVDQLITVGTPHLGAPKDYVKWEAGAFFSDIFEAAGKYFFKQEAEENGYDSIFHYLRGRPMSSVQELLPVYDYLWDDNGTDYDLRKGYPANYPRNEFLENLNSAENVKKLENVEFTKIVGKPEGAKTTISGYNVVNVNMGELWKFGYPHGFEVSRLGDQGLNKDYGDGTVPLYSAEASNVPADKKLYFQSEHNILPTDSQKDILEILTGKRPASEVNEWRIDDILIGLVFSPVDFQIISPSGKRLGKNFETGGEYNEIEGAYYTGFGTETEFLTIPNPEDGEYRILTQGTGTGEYKIEIVKIADDTMIADNADGADEAEIIITGNAEPGKEEETKIKVEGKKVEKLTLALKENTESEENRDNSIDKKLNEQEQTRIRKLDALKNNIRQYFKTGQIKSRKESRKILQKLGHIRVHLKRYETERSERAVRKQKIKANRHIENLVSRINHDFPKKIDEEAKNYIIGILEELKIE